MSNLVELSELDEDVLALLSVDNEDSEYVDLEKERIRFNSRAYHRRMRRQVLVLLGGVCVHCGFRDSRALQVDHVGGGGCREKRSITRLYYLMVIESVKANEGKYQLLCANCNWIKREENRELTGRGD